MCERWALFLQDIDYHGPARLITRNGSCLRYVCWIIVMLVVWALVIYNIAMQIGHYQSYPIVTETYVTRKSEMMFPAVTICNKKPLQTTPTQGVNQSERDYYSVNGYSLDRLVKSCEFKPMEGGVIQGINCSDALGFIQTQIYPYGNCYTFNSARKPGSDDDDDDKMMKTTDTTGIMGGLVLTMNPSNGIPSVNHAVNLPGLLYDIQPGLMMQIHNAREPADFRRGKKFQITDITGTNRPNSRYDIVINKARVYRSLSPPYSMDCEGKHRGPARYRLPERLTGKFKDMEEKDGESPDECLKRCMREKMREKNNCTLYDYQDEDGPNYSCQTVTGNNGNYPHNLDDNINNVDTEASLTVDKAVSECREECPPPCVHTDYDYDLNTYPAIGDNIVNIFFDDFITEVTEQHPIMTVNKLLSDIGLQLVLVAGFSFISFFHFLEFLLDLCIYGCQRKREVDDEENQATA